jgi:hypothetical protein
VKLGSLLVNMTERSEKKGQASKLENYGCFLKYFLFINILK